MFRNLSVPFKIRRLVSFLHPRVDRQNGEINSSRSESFNSSRLSCYMKHQGCRALLLSLQNIEVVVFYASGGCRFKPRNTEVVVLYCSRFKTSRLSCSIAPASKHRGCHGLLLPLQNIEVVVLYCSRVKNKRFLHACPKTACLCMKECKRCSVATLRVLSTCIYRPLPVALRCCSVHALYSLEIKEARCTLLASSPKSKVCSPTTSRFQKIFLFFNNFNGSD